MIGAFYYSPNSRNVLSLISLFPRILSHLRTSQSARKVPRLHFRLVEIFLMKTKGRTIKKRTINLKSASIFIMEVNYYLGLITSSSSVFSSSVFSSATTDIFSMNSKAINSATCQSVFQGCFTNPVKKT